MRKRVFANDDLPLPRRDREGIPGRGGKEGNFPRGNFPKKSHLYPVMPSDLWGDFAAGRVPAFRYPSPKWLLPPGVELPPWGALQQDEHPVPRLL